MSKLKSLISAFFLFIFLLIGIGFVSSATITVNPVDSIQNTIESANPGDTIFIEDGVYSLNSTLSVSKSLNIIGENKENVIIDASQVDGYGISISVDDIAVENLTLIGPQGGYNSSNPVWSDYRDNYGFKPSHMENLTLRNLNVRGSAISEIDLNTVNDSLIENVLIDGKNTGGFGISLASTHRVTIRNITTRNNNWGDVGVFISDQATTGVKEVVFEEDLNLSNYTGTINIQPNDAVPYGDITYSTSDTQDKLYNASANVIVPSEYSHVVYGLRSDGLENYAVVQENTASFLAQNLAKPDPDFNWSYLTIRDLKSGLWKVVENISIQSAINSASDGDTINVSVGTYTENVFVNKSITLKGFDNPSTNPSLINGTIKIQSDGVVVENLKITNTGRSGEIEGIFVGDASGYTDNPNEIIEIKNNIIETIRTNDNLTIEGIHIKSYDNGDAINGVVINNNTIKDVLEDVKGANGIKLQANVSNINITNNLIEDINGGWSYGIVTTPSSSEQGTPKRILIRNNIFSNTGIGLGIDTLSGDLFDSPSSNATEVTFLENNMLNVDIGTLNKNVNEILNASYNYWGSPNPNFTALAPINTTTTPYLNLPFNETPNTPSVSIDENDGNENRYTNSNLIKIILDATNNLPDLFRLSLDKSTWTNWIEWGHSNQKNVTDFNITNSSLGGNSDDENKTIHVESKSFTDNKNSTINNASVFYDTTANTTIELEEVTNALNSSNGEYIISPNNDGFFDTIGVDIKYSEEVKTEIYVENSSGSIVKRDIYSGPSVTNPTTPKIWDGTDEAEKVVPEGTYKIKANATDKAGNTAVIEILTVLVKYPEVAITSSSPEGSEIILKVGSLKSFEASAFESEGNPLNYSWYVNSNLIKSGIDNKSFEYNFDNVGNPVLFINISNNAGNSATKTWKLIVSDKPVTKAFTSPESTDLSQVQDLSSVKNLKLESSEGKIDFGDEVLDLTNVIDVDNAVKIEKGVLAVDTTTHPELNKSATLTLTGLNYDTIPTIFYNNDFTTNANRINSECGFCEILNYTPASTTDGEIIFEVEHFTSFRVVESGEKFDFDLFNDLDTCKSGIVGDLDLNLKDPDEGDEFGPGEEIGVKIEVENNGDEDKDILVEVALYNIDKDDVEEETDDEKEIDGEEDENLDFSLKVPDDFEDDNYILFVKAYEDRNEEFQCSEGAIEIDLERERHEVIIKDFSVNPPSVIAGKGFDIFVEAQNVGKNDEEVYIVSGIEELNVSTESDVFELEEFGKDDTRSERLFLEIPAGTHEGNYTLEIKSIFNGSEDRKTATVLVTENVPFKLEPIALSTGKIKASGEIVSEKPRVEKSPRVEEISEIPIGVPIVLFIGTIVFVILIVKIYSKRK